MFRAKRADRVKIVVWDGSGLVMYWKRLDGGGFKWPPIVAGVMRMNAAQLSALVAAKARNSAGSLGSSSGKSLIGPSLPCFASRWY
ncbi:IS66 family insertion sequence element accessory protein TnpB [Bradyrhizobium sp. Pa8]|uniref:IS66 family insertion sequence element accessory protein TnpB n=1 Tax=Bradyrhizobium sp. Pa8 TaxID=3386552 RepID=UPI00403EFD22